jgi:hypothetical protein
MASSPIESAAERRRNGKRPAPEEVEELDEEENENMVDPALLGGPRPPAKKSRTGEQTAQYFGTPPALVGRKASKKAARLTAQQVKDSRKAAAAKGAVTKARNKADREKALAEELANVTEKGKAPVGAAVRTKAAKDLAAEQKKRIEKGDEVKKLSAAIGQSSLARE